MNDRKGLFRLAACALLACGTFVWAAEPAAPARKPLMSVLDQVGVAKPLDDMGINVFGYVEGSWTYSASNPPGNRIGGRVFDFEDQDPTLNQINVTVEKLADIKKAWDIGFRMEWIYGADSRLIHSVGLFDHMGVGSGPDNQWDLAQAYVDVSVPVGNGLLVRAGKFWAGLTAESANPTVNALYSHSFLAASVPVTFTGVTGTYQIDENLSVTAGVIRGWNDSLEDHNDVISAYGAARYAIDAKTGLYAKVVVGPEQTSNPFKATKNPNGDYRTLVNVGVTHAYSDQLSVAADGLYIFDAGGASDLGDAQLYGVALYAGYKIDSMFTLNGRIEALRDEDGAFSGVKTNLYEATVGVTVTPFPNDAIGSNLKIRPEVRMDFAQDTVFDNATDDYQVTFGIDAFFTF